MLPAQVLQLLWSATAGTRLRDSASAAIVEVPRSVTGMEEAGKPECEPCCVLRVLWRRYLRVTVTTGVQADAGTDARVYLNLLGTRGQLMDLYLRETGDTFQP